MVLGCESYDFWYCLPDSRLLIVCNPETLSRVTLATLGTVFQTDIVALSARCCVGSCLLAILAINQTTKSQDNKNNRESLPSLLDGAFHFGWSFHCSRLSPSMQSEVFP